jgi:hypothetical protein
LRSNQREPEARKTLAGGATKSRSETTGHIATLNVLTRGALKGHEKGRDCHTAIECFSRTLRGAVTWRWRVLLAQPVVLDGYAIFTAG